MAKLEHFVTEYTEYLGCWLSPKGVSVIKTSVSTIPNMAPDLTSPVFPQILIGI